MYKIKDQLRKKIEKINDQLKSISFYIDNAVDKNLFEKTENFVNTYPESFSNIVIEAKRNAPNFLVQESNRLYYNLIKYCDEKKYSSISNKDEQVKDKIFMLKEKYKKNECIVESYLAVARFLNEYKNAGKIGANLKKIVSNLKIYIKKFNSIKNIYTKKDQAVFYYFYIKDAKNLVLNNWFSLKKIDMELDNSLPKVKNNYIK